MTKGEREVLRSIYGTIRSMVSICPSNPADIFRVAKAARATELGGVKLLYALDELMAGEVEEALESANVAMDLVEGIANKRPPKTTLSCSTPTEKEGDERC